MLLVTVVTNHLQKGYSCCNSKLLICFNNKFKASLLVILAVFRLWSMMFLINSTNWKAKIIK